LAHDAGVIAASLVAAGLAGQPDMGFAAAAAVAAAAAAVSEQQQQQSRRQQGTADANSSSSSSGQVADGNGYAAMPPGYVTLQVRLLVFSYVGGGAWGLYGAKLALSACWLHACAGCGLRLCVCELTDSCLRSTRSFTQGP
jgi:hypothetical protein